MKNSLKKTLLLPMAMLLATGGFATVHAANEHQHDDHVVKVHSPFVRMMPPGQPNTAAFMTLENTCRQDRALVAAESDVSKVVELHTHTMEDGVMRMREVEKIEIPAGQRTELKPGGLHIMLIGLHQPLQEGQTVDLTLVYDDGSRQVVHAPVRHPGAEMQMPNHGHHHH